ncbi:hypothetical protein C0Z17_21535 [Trinickia caryophylli]|nr:hypothetical protein C0Z17_21535 [Trinickia caryophylli]
MVHDSSAAYVEDRGQPTAAMPGNDGYYRFTDSLVGARRLAVVGESEADIAEFFDKFPERGIESAVPGQPDIYTGMFAYEPGDRFAHSLFPLNDSAMALFRGATSLASAESLTKSALLGKAAAPALPPGRVPHLPEAVRATVKTASGAIGPLEKALPDVAAAIQDRASAIKDDIKRKLHLGGAEADKATKPLVAVVFSYMPEEGMTKVGRHRVDFETLSARVPAGRRQ